MTYYNAYIFKIMNISRKMFTDYRPMRNQYYIDTVLSLVNDQNKHYNEGTGKIVTLYSVHSLYKVNN